MHLFLIIELLKLFLYQTSWQVNGCCAFVAARLLPRVCCYAFVATRLLLLSENVLMLENVKTITLNEKLCRRCNFVNRSMATKIRITEADEPYGVYGLGRSCTAISVGRPLVRRGGTGQVKYVYANLDTTRPGARPGLMLH